MVSYIKGEMQAKGIWKQDPVVNIWPKWDKNGEWIWLNNEELYCLYRLPNTLYLVRLAVNYISKSWKPPV